MKGQDQENIDEPESSPRKSPSVNNNPYGFGDPTAPYLWYPSSHSVKQIEYARRVESDFACLQRAFLALTTQFARLQFRVRQIVKAPACERESLLYDLEQLAFNGLVDDDELPRIQRDLRCMGDIRRKQNYILENLRNQLSALAEASELEGIEQELSEPTPKQTNHSGEGSLSSPPSSYDTRSSNVTISELHVEATASINSKFLAQVGLYATPCEMEDCRDHDENTCRCMH